MALIYGILLLTPKDNVWGIFKTIYMEGIHVDITD